jgi:type III pantothenate kinase
MLKQINYDLCTEKQQKMSGKKNCLVIDIGNTLSKFVIFRKGKAEDTIILENLDEDTLDKYLNSITGVTHAILSSVIDTPEWVITKLQATYKLLIFSHLTEIPIKNSYKTPETLGKDRLASAIGAFSMFPDKDVLSIDAGTCIKYDFVSKSGEYIGGAISPGIKMRLRAMNAFTARLPLVHPEGELMLTGGSTEESLRTGGVLGAVAEVDKIIDYYKEKYGDIQVVITGGDLKYFVNQLKNSIFAHPNLVVLGLHEILLFNEI